jgi:hypothetical protein
MPTKKKSSTTANHKPAIKSSARKKTATNKSSQKSVMKQEKLKDYLINYKGISYQFKEQQFSPQQYMILRILEQANNIFTGLPPNKPVTLKRIQQLIPKKSQIKKSEIEQAIIEINKISPKAITRKANKDKPATYQVNISTASLYNSRTIVIPSVKNKSAVGQFIIHFETGELAESKQNSYRLDNRIDAGDCYGRIYLQRQPSQAVVYQIMPHPFAEALEKAVSLKDKGSDSYLVKASDDLIINFKKTASKNKKKSKSVIELSLIKLADNRVVHFNFNSENDINKQLITVKNCLALAEGLRNPEAVIYSGKVIN